MGKARYATAAALGLALIGLWHSTDRDSLVREGNAALTAGRMAEAEDAYRRALADPSERSAALFNLAVLLGQRGDHSGSADTFTEALRSGLSGDPRGWALYNRGVALSHMGRWTEGVHEFRQALLRLPGNQDIRTNLEIAQARARAQASKPIAPPPPPDVKRLLERMPDPTLDFARGRRATSTAALDDW